MHKPIITPGLYLREQGITMKEWVELQAWEREELLNLAREELTKCR